MAKYHLKAEPGKFTKADMFGKRAPAADPGIRPVVMTGPQILEYVRRLIIRLDRTTAYLIAVDMAIKEQPGKYPTVNEMTIENMIQENLKVLDEAKGK